MAAASCFGQEAFKGIQCIDTLRLFMDCIDFSDHDSDGWRILLALHSTKIRGCSDKEQYLPILWTLSLFSSELKDNTDENYFATMLRWNLPFKSSQELTGVLLGINRNLMVDARETPNGYSTLQYMITSGSNTSAQNNHAIELLLGNGADPHLVSFNPHYSSQPETPTSLALYTSSAFTQWRNALKNMSLDFEAFVKKELQRGPLREAGWCQDTLLALFRQDFRSGAEPQYKHDFGECPHILSALIVEPCWLHWLQEFRDTMSIDTRPGGRRGTNSKKSNQGRILLEGLESVRIQNSAGDEFERLETAETSIDGLYEREPEHDESFHVKPQYNPALFENGSVRPRFTCTGCWSRNKWVESVPLRGSATPSSACTQGGDFLPLSRVPKRSRR